ncbi:hypothetical protein RM697_06310 [Ichthyenterobacterium sp. W332]|uniref:Uncharacterized protein n=1 Tax=Microcosmobacter mediterraneus TaxID=3075607 RepID=A0ABU2YJ99_9FLAO|nr:hypothetical protein [Ichthyenterobacterium sp. W332]MDT0558249.1 hypothetical protein [Ichthyenterobacterium sp. W332]
MKKKLESELISIAHRVLKLKGKEDVKKMYDEVALLQEKLAVLKFAHENFEDDIPTIGSNSSFFGMLDAAFNNKVSDNIEVEDKIYVNLDEKEEQEITQPLMEKIKDMVAHMPQEEAQVETLFKEPTKPNGAYKNDFEDITADFAKIPEFEPIEDAKKREEEEKKSLNDKLKGNGLQIGLNDKIAFIKHLFDGKNEDYDRVISQINTSTTLQDAKLLIQNIVKPDYNNWDGKEDYEERLMEIIEGKFS